MKHRLDSKKIIVILIFTAVISIIACIGIGPVFIDPKSIMRIILLKLPVVQGIIPDWTPAQENIVWMVRLPRVLLGFCVGCSLAFSGACMQALVKNSLADPYILGVSYGAAAFSTIGVVFGLFSSLGVFAMSVNGCIGALLSLGFVFLYSLNRGKINVTQLLLGGIAIAYFMRAVVKLLVSTNVQAFLHNNTAFWTSGGLAGTRWQYLQVTLPLILVCFALLLLNYRALNALLFGEETAQTLGVDVKSVQKLLLIATSLMIGITVSVSGGIGFVGLVIPHVSRLLIGSDHKKVFPVSALLGGVFVIWCDVAARMLFAPQEISVGIVTAIIGGPFFVYLLKKRSVMSQTAPGKRKTPQSRA